MNTTILIIDDDAKLNRLLIGFLSDFGFKVVAATRPEEGLKKLGREAPDLIILDGMFPEILRKIRGTLMIPIILLTPRGGAKKINGVKRGADDYLRKPFEPKELMTHIQAVLRKAPGFDKSGVEQFDRLEIDFAKHIARLDGVLLDLTANEFAALDLLVKNKGKVLNRDQIIETLRGIEWDALNRSADITMSRLRHKLNDDPKNPSFIKTVWGIGYEFIG